MRGDRGSRASFKNESKVDVYTAILVIRKKMTRVHFHHDDEVFVKKQGFSSLAFKKSKTKLDISLTYQHD